MSEKLFYSFFKSPVGEFLLVSDGLRIHHIEFQGKALPSWKKKEAPFKTLKKELSQYFDFKLKKFQTPFFLRGGEFEKKVLKALLRIPYGETKSYKEIASLIGNPKASRAVGLINSKNPLPLLIPCHRVIRSDSSLGGYNGGVCLKKYLLELEGRTPKK